MSSILIRAGRFWLNPRFLISVEERGARDSILLPSGNHMIIKMLRGDSIDLWGEDAEALRRALESTATDTVVPAEESGSGPGPRISRKSGA